MEEQAWSEDLQGLFNLLKSSTVSWLYTGEERTAALWTNHCSRLPRLVRRSKASRVGSQQDRWRRFQIRFAAF